jgi:hypothetical protein
MSAARVRRAFMRGSFVISLLVFCVVGGSILLDQWIAGHANARFILGTAILAAGASLGLFATGAAIGLVISTMLRDETFGRSDEADPSHPPSHVEI